MCGTLVERVKRTVVPPALLSAGEGLWDQETRNQVFLQQAIGDQSYKRPLRVVEPAVRDGQGPLAGLEAPSCREQQGR